jgi:hypothetical protein
VLTWSGEFSAQHRTKRNIKTWNRLQLTSRFSSVM